MSGLAEALREHYEELLRIADEAGNLADALDEAPFAVDRGELRDLLVREFEPDLTAPAAGLLFEEVIDDIARIVARAYTAQVLDLQDAIQVAYAGVDVEEAARDAALERRFHCLDCDVHTSAIGEYYMLRDEVWLEANPDGDGMLCVGCLEKRLGRRLEPTDFTESTHNFVDRASPRLRSRVLGVEEVRSGDDRTAA
jgi:hypothetical protein